MLLLLVITTAHGQSQERNPVAAHGRIEQPAATDRIIIKWRNAESTGSSPAERATKASKLARTSLSAKQSISAAIDVVQLQTPLSAAALNSTIGQLLADPQVEYAAPDLRRHIHAVTSDPLLSEQWYLLSAQPAATGTDHAWDLTKGSSAVVVAVLDTGVRFDHPDLGRSSAGGKILAGYDFVTDVAVANDGDGRDADPSDPGDWVTEADKQQPEFTKCDAASSSWHGTRVAGLIGGLTDNGVGVAGAGWNTRVLPVRVLGKCGGYDSDIIAGMRWAAGLAVAGAPVNPTPAQVINLSLGSDGGCTAAYRAAVDEITAKGVLIVASAGNEGGPVSAPANCPGVLGVAGLRHVGTKVGFSSLGPEIGIGAPGGNCVNTSGNLPCLFSIVVATDSGTRTPLAATYTDQNPLTANLGTSFSGPMAAATAALMRSVNSNLSPDQLTTLIKRSSTPFPASDASIPQCHVSTSDADLQQAECGCTTQTCGAGMLNTGAAVDAAVRPFVILQNTGDATAGSSIVLNGSSSFASNGRTLTTFLWSVVNVSGTAPVVLSPAQASTTLNIPGAATFTVRLTVTDDQGGESSEEATFTAAAPPVAPPVTTPHAGGGGGGTMGWELLGLVALWTRVKSAGRTRAVKGRQA
jgi:serine protease